jgi:RNA recognition motif-containing protein
MCAEEHVEMVKLFVGNLAWSVGDQELESLFSQHGEVQSARVITDRDTGRSRGFGFVEIETDDVAGVINATNGQEIGGRAVRVNEAEDKPRGGFGGGGRGNDRGGYRSRY